jgi:LPS-assembly protein
MHRVKALAFRPLAVLAACASIFQLSPAIAQAPACPGPALAVALPEQPDRLAAPIYLEARHFTATADQPAQAHGGVRLERADQRLETEVLQYDPVSETLTLPVPLLYRDARIILDAERGEYGFNEESGTFSSVEYQFVGATAHGRADEVRVEHRIRSYLVNPEFTTCPGDDPEWLLSAGEVEFHHDKGIGIARHAKLEFMDIPILYAPWFSFPIDDRRKSGFLYPVASIANDNGVEVGIPYYWNIAPNQDATLTPRYFSDRGLMLTGEYRLLTHHTRGLLDFDYLANDKNTNTLRYQYRVNHVARFNRQWRSRVAVQRVSDDQYFQDFGISLAETARQFLRSSAGISGAGRYWTFSLFADDFQVIDESVSERREPYRRMPRVLFEIDRPLGARGLEFSLESEAVYFDRPVGVTGARFDLYPRIGWNLDRYWGFIRAGAGYRYTAYSLDRQGLPGDQSPDRGTSIVSLDSGLLFEREQGNGWVQTLEPRIFYLHVPYEEQSELPDFDTSKFTFGYSQLFHTNQFTSADRQSNANQVTLAVATRSMNPGTGRERWSLGLGQIFYFDELRVSLNSKPPDASDASPFIGEFNWFPSSRFSGRVAAQWNWDSREIDVWALGMDYRSGNLGRFGLEYRFRRDRLDQFDIRYLWPINERWTVLSRLKYSLDDRDLLEAQAGLEYESCCWGVRLIGRRYLRNRDGDARDAIYLELRLKGLGDFGRKSPPLFYDDAE